MKKLYRLTDEEYDRLIKAATPQPYLVLSGGVEPFSQSHRIMELWAIVAKRVGCDVHSITPAPKNGLYDEKDFMGEALKT